MRIHSKASVTRCLVATALLALAACSAPQPAPVTAAASSAASGNAEVRLGGVTARASAIQTSLLAEAVARQYGVTRDPRSVLLLVALDTASTPAGTGSPTASVHATVTDLRGSRTDIAMHPVQADGSVDWIGVTATSLPDTLRFDVTVTVGTEATARMQIQREFFPR